jgi:hypothetical protein
VSPADAASPTFWVEPSRAISLRFGSYELRYSLGLLYVVAGGVILVGSDTYTVPFLLVGTVAHVAGWYILPGRGVRRVWMSGPSLLAVWLLLTGPQIEFVLVLPLLSWLVVRQRPLLSFVTLVIPVGVGIVLTNVYTDNHDQPQALAMGFVALVASAWIARALAVARRHPVPEPVEGPAVE